MSAIGKIAVAKASLPTNYQEAKTALAECARIDECKSWADKATALASYAKQADDERLLSYAKRIKVRAIDRMGELIEAIPPKAGQAAKGKNTTGSDSIPSRAEFARGTGISERQQVTAMRVHAVPRDEFERQVRDLARCAALERECMAIVAELAATAQVRPLAEFSLMWRNP